MGGGKKPVDNRPRPNGISPRALVGLLAVAPTLAFAQTGRMFPTVESYVALAESVRVGEVTKLERIEYDSPLVGAQN